MVGRQLPFFSLLVPFWLIWAFAGRKAMMEIWPAILVSGRELRDPAVPGLQLHRPGAGRRDRGDQSRWSAWSCSCASGSRRRSGPRPRSATARPRSSGAPARRRARRRRPCRRWQPPASPISARERRPRSRRARHAGGRLRPAGSCRRQDLHAAPARRRDPRLDAVADPDRVRLRLGPAAGQERAQRHLRAELPDRRAAPAGREDAAGGAEADQGRRGLHLQPAVGDRHRHPARGHRSAAC